jgi:uncharacterized protein
MISKGLITQRANDERLPAHTVERDYILAQLVAEIGAAGNERLVFKGGTLLRLCYFADYRYSADLDFSATNGLTAAEALSIVGTAIAACRARLELPVLDLAEQNGAPPWITYVGPLGAKPRKLKLDISDDELVTSQVRIALFQRWPDLPNNAAIESYTLDEVGAEKLRCVAERLQCRDLYDLHELVNTANIDPIELWHRYLHKAENDVIRGRQRTSPQDWLVTFERRMPAYRDRWENELGNYLPGSVPSFRDIERRIRRTLGSLLEAARERQSSF